MYTWCIHDGVYMNVFDGALKAGVEIKPKSVNTAVHSF